MVCPNFYMGFPFNLFSIDWADSRVPEWLAALADDMPLVREEAFDELEDHLVSAVGVDVAAAAVVEPLSALIGTESAKGRALAAVLLSNVAQHARRWPGPPSTDFLEALPAERAGLQTLAARHDASTALGAALRLLLSVPTDAQLEAIEQLVREADAKDEAPPPTAEELREWIERVKRGELHATPYAQRAFAVDPKQALAILNAAPLAEKGTPAQTSVEQVDRAVLEARCQDALNEPVTIAKTGWSRTAQARLLDAAVAYPKVGAALLAAVTDPAHAIRRRAVEVRVKHEAKSQDAWPLADALAADWLKPSKTGAVNQSLSRGELLSLLALFPESNKRAAELKAAPAPEIAMPDGEAL